LFRRSDQGSEWHVSLSCHATPGNKIKIPLSAAEVNSDDERDQRAVVFDNQTQAR
jgi:hypothetical protein